MSIAEVSPGFFESEVSVVVGSSPYELTQNTIAFVASKHITSSSALGFLFSEV